MYYTSCHVLIPIHPCTYSTNMISLSVDLYSFASTPSTCTFVSTCLHPFKTKVIRLEDSTFCDAWSSGQYRHQRSIRQELCAESTSNAFLQMLQPVPQDYQKLPVGISRTVGELNSSLIFHTLPRHGCLKYVRLDVKYQHRRQSSPLA